MRNRNGKKPDSSNNKTTSPPFTPKRQLTHTPPPVGNPPIAGTPLTIQWDKAPPIQPDEALATRLNKDPTTQPEKAPPEPSKSMRGDPAMRKADVENFHLATITTAEQLMVSALQQLQKIHDEAGEAGKAEITIERATFKAIATSINEAYEQIKQYKESENKPVATEESPVLDILKKIQVRITIFKQKYESIKTKVTKAPKTYAEMIKSTSISPEPKDKKIEL